MNNVTLKNIMEALLMSADKPLSLEDLASVFDAWEKPEKEQIEQALKALSDDYEHRADIEDVRGVAVSSSILKTLLERQWIKIAGHRDVPGKPAIYSTTKQFLDYFNMTALNELPPLPAQQGVIDQTTEEYVE